MLLYKKFKAAYGDGSHQSPTLSWQN